MFTFNGVDFSGYLVVNAISRDILPPAILINTSVPRRDGAYFFNRRSDVRTIEVNVSIIEEELPDLRDKIREIAALLFTEDPQELCFRDEPDKKYLAIVGGNTDLDEIAAIGQGTITFIIHDPTAYSAEETEEPSFATASFTRASSGFQRDGIQKATNEPRFAAAFGSGLLIEEGTTNLVGTTGFLDTDTNTDGLANGWTAYSSGAGAGVYTMSTTVRAFQRSQSQKIQRTAGAVVGNYGIFKQITGISNPNANAFLVNVESLTGTATVTLNCDYFNSVGGYLETKSTTISATTGGEFLRYELAPSTNVNIFRVDIYIWIANDDGICYVQAVQSENKQYSTTLTNGTRANEYCSFASAGIVNNAEGTIEVQFRSFIPTGIVTQYIFYGNGSTGNNLLLYCEGAGRIVLKYGDGVTEVTLTGTTVINQFTTYKISAKWGSAGGKLFINGTQEATSSTAANVVVGSTVYIGCKNTGLEQANGTIDSYTFSNVARADAEISSRAAEPFFAIDENVTGKFEFIQSLDIVKRLEFIPLGTAKAYPVITWGFTVTTDEWSFEHLENGQKITIMDSFSPGDVLVVDNYKRLITLNGVRFMEFLTLDSTWISLNPGVMNTVFANLGNYELTYLPRFL